MNALQPPPSLATVHQTSLLGFASYSRGGHLALSGMQSSNPILLSEAANAITEGGAYFREATAMMNARNQRSE